MSNRSWFFASQGKQQGPYPEAQLREFIANGTVTAETLVRTEGMAGWQKARDIRGLLFGDSRPAAVPPSGTPLTTDAAGQPLSVDFSIWALLGRSLLLMIGFLPVVHRPGRRPVSTGGSSSACAFRSGLTSASPASPATSGT